MDQHNSATALAQQWMRAQPLRDQRWYPEVVRAFELAMRGTPRISLNVPEKLLPSLDRAWALRGGGGSEVALDDAPVYENFFLSAKKLYEQTRLKANIVKQRLEGENPIIKYTISQEEIDPHTTNPDKELSMQYDSSVDDIQSKLHAEMLKEASNLLCPNGRGAGTFTDTKKPMMNCGEHTPVKVKGPDTAAMEAYVEESKQALDEILGGTSAQDAQAQTESMQDLLDHDDDDEDNLLDALLG